MDQLVFPSAKLLYLANEMFNLKMIQNNEKIQIKEFILSENEQIYKLLEKYPKSDTELILAEEIMQMIRGQQSKQQQGQQHDDDDYQKNVEIPAECSSPLGNQLMKRKRAKQTGQKMNEISNLLKPYRQT